MSLDDFAHEGQPHTAALDLVARPERLKHAEDFLMKLGRNSRAVVRHAENIEVAFLDRGDLQYAGITVVVLDGV
jgi:hypothetical protein